jgi:hypothetical protein
VLHVGDLGIDRLHRALGSAVRQLNQSGLDSAAAQLLIADLRFGVVRGLQTPNRPDLTLTLPRMRNVACRLAPCLEERQSKESNQTKRPPKAVTGNWQNEKAAGHFPPPKTAPRPPGEN